jgi:hypothetical protein
MDANKLAKRKADKDFKLSEVREMIRKHLKHYNITDYTGKPSRKKSQAKQVMRQRIRCEHLRNPEESFSFKHDN